MTAALDCDVVLAGAGIVGGLLANKLGQAGLRVVLLDVGDRSYFDLDPSNPLGTDQRQPLLDNYYGNTSAAPNSPYPNLAYAPMPYEENLAAYYTGPAYNPDNPTGNTPPQFKSSYARIVGGTTYHWLGVSLRYLPTTFREYTLYGRGADWPLSYEELAPWYHRAEIEIGVAGNSDEDLGSPRYGAKFPMPEILPSYQDRRIAARIGDMRFDGLPVRIQVTPQGRNSVPYQNRPPCSGSANCIPICPIQAKWDATIPIKRALNPALDPHNRPGSRAVEFRRGAVVTKVLVGDGEPGHAPVTGLVYKDGHTREEHVIRAKAYVLCAHAMETAKILLMSPWRDQMTVANSSDAVGRHLMDHNIKITTAVIDEPIYPFRGPKATSGIETLRDGPFRRHRGAFRVEIQNVSANWALNTPYSNLRDLLNANLIGRELSQQLAWDVVRTVQLDALVEPEGQWDSTIRPSKTKFDELGVPRPEIHYRIDDYTERGGDAFVDLARRIYERMGATFVNVVPGFGGAGHVMGTLRMGHDAKTSVADRDGRSHDHPNLWLTGSGLFPTVDSANPTLTIAAVTLRQAERLIEAMQAG
jgi:choline dehydrogenase-like flavoprotein